MRAPWPPREPILPHRVSTDNKLNCTHSVSSARINCSTCLAIKYIQFAGLSIVSLRYELNSVPPFAGFFLRLRAASLALLSIPFGRVE